MATLTLRPDATIANGGSTVTGAATRHEALADDSDSSYVRLDDIGDNPRLGFEEPSIPAGAVVKSIALRARVAREAGFGLTSGQGEVSLYGPEELSSSVVMITWTSPTAITVGTIPITDEPSTIEVQIEATGGTAPIRLYELFVDVVYVPKPVVDVLSPTGTVTEDNSPVVTFEADLDSGGGAQTHFEAKVFDAATYAGGGFDPDTSPAVVESGVVASSATSWDFEDTLPNGSYEAIARVAQTVNGGLLWSEWSE